MLVNEHRARTICKFVIFLNNYLVLQPIRWRLTRDDYNFGHAVVYLSLLSCDLTCCLAFSHISGKAQIEAASGEIAEHPLSDR